MKKEIFAFMFGAITFGAVYLSSGYTIIDWQFWATVMPIVIAGLVYSNLE